MTTDDVDRAPVEGATVRLGNRRVVTDESGKARVHIRYFHPGLKSVRASLPGYRSATQRIRVLGG